MQTQLFIKYYLKIATQLAKFGQQRTHCIYWIAACSMQVGTSTVYTAVECKKIFWAVFIKSRYLEKFSSMDCVGDDQEELSE